MQYLCTREEMQRIDAYSIQEIGIPGIVLMEKAAMAMEEEVIKRFPAGASVMILAERGNNGGDGLALGRLLMSKGYEVAFYEIGGVKRASDSYMAQRSILDRLGASFEKSLPKREYDIWVDAVFGVGLKREVTGVHRQLIEEVNGRKGYKIAVDVPSGVDASTGHILGISFQADLTITFGLSKVGLVLYPGASCAGEVVVKDIGFPQEAVDHAAPGICTFTEADLGGLPERVPWSNKGSYGKALLIAGQKNMAGAAYLSGLAAYRSGSGLVRIFTCEENRTILQELLPEALLTTYASEEEAMALLPEALSWATVVGIGPGLGQTSFSIRLVREVLGRAHAPLVVDADGINCLAQMRDRDEAAFCSLYNFCPGGMILTPHLKEMSRLTGLPVGEIRKDIVGVAANAADEKHIYVLKDARTAVSDGTLPAYINMSGNHGMSTGGSGDVLTGMICGFLAGGLGLLAAARMGVYCHGLAGDKASADRGRYGLTAGDLAEYLGRVIH